MKTFTVASEHFLLDGQPYRLLSGAMHYFRIPRQYWSDRLLKLRDMGLNTLETYVAWNLHEPRPGEFHFDGDLDLAEYIRLAAGLGLNVIVRPGPYICSEWDFGGLPAWLLKDPGMRVRCMHLPYLAAVERFFDALLPHFAPLQLSHGGPVIAVQVENEYGSYGNDKAYLRWLVDALRSRGIDSLLFTSDGERGALLQSGTLPEIYKTVNFPDHPEIAFQALRSFQPDAPLMCTEFWCGWFDHWGEVHHTRPPEHTAATLDQMLAAGASVNFYMFHGGTNFGFMNGANTENGEYQPDVTSYDYDAPLSEAGDLTPKYHACREVIGRYADLPHLPPPAPVARLSLGPLQARESAGLFEALPLLSHPLISATPEPMETYDQDYGFILYRTRVPGPRPASPLMLRGLHDRAQVFLDGQPAGVLQRGPSDPALEIEIPPAGLQIDLLVENMGRVNFGPDLLDRKGLTGGVLLGQQFLFGWTVFPLPLADLSALQFEPQDSARPGPAFYRLRFDISRSQDTFLALPGWTKGIAWVNGFNLGRYWEIGPQRTLYVPAPRLHPGENELVIFELHDPGERRVEFRPAPDLG